MRIKSLHYLLQVFRLGLEQPFLNPGTDSVKRCWNCGASYVQDLSTFWGRGLTLAFLGSCAADVVWLQLIRVTLISLLHATFSVRKAPWWMINGFQTHLLGEAVWYFYFFFLITSGPVILHLCPSNTCKAWKWVLWPLCAGGCVPTSMWSRVCPCRTGCAAYTGWWGWLSFYFSLFPWKWREICASFSLIFGWAAWGAGVSLFLPSPAASWGRFGLQAGCKACTNLSLALRARP